MDYEKYKQAVQKKVCGHCLDSNEQGRCTLTSEHECGIMLYFNEIVDVVRSTKSDQMSDYIRILRARVCSHCKNEDPHGLCQFRINTDCGLDRFFELVVEAIEEVDALP